MKFARSKIGLFIVTFFCIALLFTMSLSVIAFAADSTAEDSSESEVDSVLYEKTALFCGDSICAAGMDEENGWAGRIGAQYGMTVTNKGSAGASVSTCRDENRILAQINDVKDNTYDYVILHGGVNDAMESAPIGIVTDSFDIADFDADTFAGGLEELFYYANEYFGEQAYIGYIINYQTPLSKWGGETTDMSAYFDVAKQVCDKWKMPYLDLYNDEDFNDNVLNVTSDENLPDFLHLNASGYDIVYKPIGAWMEELSIVAENTLYWIIGGVVVLVAAGVIVYVIIKKKKK